MRFIQPSSVQLAAPADWKEAALKLSQDLVASEPGEGRDELLRKAHQEWQRIKPALEEVSKGKCWYCETGQTRAPNDVDHFRPKSSVAECDGHTGYYWLAIKLENLRLSCQFCNRYGSEATRSRPGGKADRFPLMDESQRCSDPSGDLNGESPVLLDPTCVDDPSLLWIDEFGRPTTNPDKAPAASEAEHRVVASISILNLDEKRIVDERLRVSMQVTEVIETAEAISAVDRPHEYRKQIERLVDMARGSSEYSLAARCRLRERDRGHGSVARFVLENL